MNESDLEVPFANDSPSKSDRESVLNETQLSSSNAELHDVDKDLPEGSQDVQIPADIGGTDESSIEPMSDTIRIQNVETQSEMENQINQEAVAETAKDPINGSPRKPNRRLRWLFVSIIGLLILALVALISGFSGYYSAISMRQDASFTQEARIAKEQFEFGLKDMEQGNYFRARQRFEYVIQLDPSYPGAVDKLADVLLELNTTATPTLVPTPTLSPTPDLRGVQEVYDQATQYLLNEEWSTAIETLLQLRKTDPEYKKVEVDGMLFLALRNRAEDKILIEADLESGIYDLTLAQQFGVIDAQGQALFDWATFYITGASFWGLDWGQAAYYFGQVAPHAPNLRDGSMLTASERYRIALLNYAKQLFNKKQFCEAQSQLNVALSLYQDGEIQNAYQQAAQACEASQQPRQGPGGQTTQTP